MSTSPSGATSLVAAGRVIPQLQFTQSKLVKWRAALANVQCGGGNAKVAFIGDSTDQGQYASGVIYTGNRTLATSDAFARRLQGIGIPANVASQTGGGNTITTTANFTLYDPRTTFAGSGWTLPAITTAGGTAFYNASTTDLFNFTPTDTAGGALSFDRIDVTYLKQSTYANFTVAVDGGAAAYTSTQAGSGAMDTVTVSVAAGTHTVNIQKTAGDIAKGFYLIGIKCYSSTLKQVHVLNFGAGGYTSANAASTAVYFSTLPAIQHFAPHLSIINIGLNDMAGAVSVATYKANIQAIITACAATGSVVLRTPNPAQVGFSGTAAGVEVAYNSALYDLASENNLVIIDNWQRQIDWTAMVANGMIVDPVHPNKLGYQDVANAIYAMAQPTY
jgi:lysophospholipase L1-like esterase